MHSAVMQNKKYIKFAGKTTVEVIALSRLEEGVEKGDRKAATYEVKKPDGTVEQQLVKFPGLTVADMVALNRSKASSYNQTGKIPYTSVVDPFTLEEIAGWSGGIGSKTIMQSAEKAKKLLAKEHGKPAITRKDLAELAKLEAKVDAALAKSDFGAVFKLVAPFQKKASNWPAQAQARVEKAEERALDLARAELDAIAAIAGDKPVVAKKQLLRILPKIKGTKLADRAAELRRSLSTGN